MMHKERIKLLVTGPESTGKSTIASYISDKWKYTLVKEYAREYLELKNDTYAKEDLLQIAKKHHELVQKETQIKTHLVLDTYLLNIKIWSEFKYGPCDSWIIDTLKSIQVNHVFLTSTGVPWTYDPLRENEDNRSELFNIFKKELIDLNWPFTILKDDQQEREKQVDAFLKEYSF